MGCTPDGDLAPSPASPTAETPSAEALRYAFEDCPITDEGFCTTAFKMLEALQRHDPDVVVALSRASRLECAELATDSFPACATDDVLKGYAVSGPDLLVEIVDEAEYRGRLEAVVGGFDPSFSDDLGGGGVRIVGVGTCGPDVPGRRTYHLAWTAAVAETGAAAERVLRAPPGSPGSYSAAWPSSASAPELPKRRLAPFRSAVTP